MIEKIFTRSFNFRQNEPVRRASSRFRRVSGSRGARPDIQQSQRKELTRKFLHDGSVIIIRLSYFSINRKLISLSFRDPKSTLPS